MIETPNSVPSPSPSVATSDGISIGGASAYYNSNINNTTTPTADSNSSKSDTRSTPLVSTTTDPGYNQQQTQPQTQQQQGKQISRAVTPARPASSFEFDPRLQGVLNQLTPSQLQHLLSSLASQSLNDPTPPGPSISSGTINPSATNTTNGLLTAYQQPTSFDFSINPSAQTNTYNSAGIHAISPDGLIPFDTYNPGSPNDDRHDESSNLGLVNNLNPEQQQREARMERSWQATEDIDKDVNALNTSINSLIQTYGLDPSLLDDNLNSGLGSGDNTVPLTHEDNLQGHAAPESNVNASDFDFFNSFFNNMSAAAGGAAGLHGVDNVGGGNTTGDMDYGDLASTAFLDEAPTPMSDLTTSPAQSLRQVSPGLLDLGTANDNDVTSPSSGLNLASSGGGTKAAAAGSDVAGGRLKRKSDVIMDFEDINAAAEQGSPTKPTATSPGTSKTKRRKDK